MAFSNRRGRVQVPMDGYDPTVIVAAPMTAVLLLLIIIVAAACACVVSLCFGAGVEAERVFEYAARNTTTSATSSQSLSCGVRRIEVSAAPPR